MSPEKISLRRLPFAILAIILLAHTAPVSAQLDPRMLGEFNWRLLGPSSPAGRVWQIVGVESDTKTFYVCTAGGGLWKSTNSGTTLVPVFEHQTSASTGAVAVAKSNPNIVWVGT